MLNKKIKITVMTRLENEDHFKIARLIETYVECGTTLCMESTNNGIIEITFTTLKSLTKSFEHDLSVLNLIGIDGTIKEA